MLGNVFLKKFITIVLKNPNLISLRWGLISDLIKVQKKRKIESLRFIFHLKIPHPKLPCKKGRLVCKTWCQYLTYDRILWLNILLKSRLYLEMFFNKLSHEKYKLTSALFSDFTKDFFQCIKDRNLHYEHVY